MRKFFFLAIIFIGTFAAAQKKAVPASQEPDSLLLTTTKYRLVGPWRGGRSAAVAGR